MTQQDKDVLVVAFMSGMVMCLALTGMIQIVHLIRGARS